MDREIIIWASVVCLLALAFAIKAISDFRKGKPHFIEIAKEEDIFYCPGDIKDYRRRGDL